MHGGTQDCCFFFMSGPSSLASCCCRASDQEDEWWSWGGRDHRQDLARPTQALRVKNPLADSPWWRPCLVWGAVPKHHTASLLVKNAAGAPGTENNEAGISCNALHCEEASGFCEASLGLKKKDFFCIGLQCIDATLVALYWLICRCPLAMSVYMSSLNTCSLLAPFGGVSPCQHLHHMWTRSSIGENPKTDLLHLLSTFTK